MRLKQWSALAVIGAAGMIAVSACDDETTTAGPPVPRTMVVSGGDNQEGLVGSTLAEDLQVTVTGSDDQPYAGAEVTFTVTSRTGSLSVETATTGSGGTASVQLTLGLIAERVSVQASLGALTANFSARALAASPAGTDVDAGDEQGAGFGETLADPIVAKVVDASGNPVQGAAVTWATPDGGSFSGAQGISDAAGIAQAIWTLGPGEGPQTATATSSGGVATFSATAFNCTPNVHTVGTTDNGTIATNGPSCPNPALGTYEEYYDFTLAASGAVSLALTTSAFNPLLQVEANGVVFAVAPSTLVGTASFAKVIVGAGTTRSIVTTQGAGESGAFSITSIAGSEDNADGCLVGEIFIADGYETNQVLETTDCTFFGQWYSDWFSVYLEAGDEASITMGSSVVDSYIQLIDPGFTGVIDFADAGGIGDTEVLVHDAQETGVYTVDASTFNSFETGAYFFSISVSRSGSAPRAGVAASGIPAQLPSVPWQIEKVKR